MGTASFYEVDEFARVPENLLMPLAALILAAIPAQDPQLAHYASVEGWAETRDARLAWRHEGGRLEGKDHPQHYAEWIQNWATVPRADYARAAGLRV